MPSQVYVLMLLFLLSYAIIDTAFIHPEPAGSGPLLNVGTIEGISLQWTTTEILSRVIPWLYCPSINYLINGCGVISSGNQIQSCLFGINSNYLHSVTNGTPTACMFQLRILEFAGAPPGPKAPLANSTIVQLVAKNTVATSSTISDLVGTSSRYGYTLSTGFLLASSSLPSVTSSSLPSITSSSLPSITSSPTHLPRRPSGLVLGLGLGLGVPLLLTALSVVVFLATQQRHRQNQKKTPAKSNWNTFEKPELDAQETVTIVQNEPRELRHSVDAPYELEGNMIHAQELDDGMLGRHRRRETEAGPCSILELYNEEEIRQITSELDGRMETA